MPVVAIINRKGGSGKSTLATHLAGHCANAGAAVVEARGSHAIYESKPAAVASLIEKAATAKH